MRRRTPRPAADDDEALRIRTLGRDPAVLEWLYRRHAPAVFGFVRHLVGDQAAAEDVVQDVFLQVWRTLHTYDPDRGPVRAWLMSMARSHALDHLRRRALEARVRPFSGDAGASGAEEAGSDRHLTRAAVREAVRALPPGQRRAIHAVYFAGLSQVEAAARLLVPLGTLKGRVRLSMRRLRKVLDAAPRKE